MSDSRTGDRLSSQDALFVYLEKKEMPLHIGSISVFDGPIALNRLKAFVEAKLPLIPRYRQRLAFPPLFLGHPTWEFDPDFDISRHIHHIQLPHGTNDELQAVAGQIFGEIMDRERPLWDITVVDGVEGNRSALIARVHHCMVDGIAGVALINVLLDRSPKPPRLPKKQTFVAPPLPDAATRVISALVSSYDSITSRMLNAQSAALNVAQALMSDLPATSPEQIARMLPELFLPVERLPFNKPVLGPRKLSWTEFPLTEFKAVREAAGGTLNDIVLAIVTDAVRRYCELHGESLKGRQVRMMVPVNLRSDPSNPGVGNDLSLIPVSLPLDIADPLELLTAVHRKTETMKRTHIADLIVLGGIWMGAAPAPLQAAFGLLGNVLPVPPWNMVCTNVPGPQFPLYALGREMLTYYPYVPIGNDMGVCVAIESYNGKFFINFTGDAASAPDLDVLRDYLITAFDDLKKRAGIAPVEKKAHRPKAEVKAPPPTVRPRRKRPAQNGKGATPVKSVQTKSPEAARPLEPVVEVVESAVAS
jgi:diacylglycerol O-acyltransferase